MRQTLKKHPRPTPLSQESSNSLTTSLIHRGCVFNGAITYRIYDEAIRMSGMRESFAAASKELCYGCHREAGALRCSLRGGRARWFESTDSTSRVALHPCVHGSLTSRRSVPDYLIPQTRSRRIPRSFQIIHVVPSSRPILQSGQLSHPFIESLPRAYWSMAAPRSQSNAALSPYASLGWCFGSPHILRLGTIAQDLTHYGGLHDGERKSPSCTLS